MDMKYVVVLFYKYVALTDVDEVVCRYQNLCIQNGLLGRLLVAFEGVNGTLSGSNVGIMKFCEAMSADDNFNNIEWKFSTGSGSHLPFPNLSVRRVKELISPGAAASNVISQQISFDASAVGGLAGTGMHLDPKEFHSGK